jgi:hypothetical protein
MVAQEEVTTHKKTRIISVVAATAIALACGTNVGYYSDLAGLCSYMTVCLLRMGASIRR